MIKMYMETKQNTSPSKYVKAHGNEPFQHSNYTTPKTNSTDYNGPYQMRKKK